MQSDRRPHGAYNRGESVRCHRLDQPILLVTASLPSKFQGQLPVGRVELQQVFEHADRQEHFLVGGYERHKKRMGLQWNLWVNIRWWKQWSG